MTSVPHAAPGAGAALLPQVVDAVQAAGDVLLDRFAAVPSLITLDEVVAAIHANDAAALEVLRPLLQAARPAAGWVDDELDAGSLGPGEWWVVDPVEGNVNHVHGMADWAVSATLVRDEEPVLTAVHLPLVPATCTAVRGGGAFQDGVRLRTSRKRELRAALVATGQASPREERETWARIGSSTTAMLEAALTVRVAVPATLQLLQVAAGRMEAFWQHSAVRSGLLAGALLVEEAGGSVTDLGGQPWDLSSPDFLATTPELRADVLTVLRPTR